MVSLRRTTGTLSARSKSREWDRLAWLAVTSAFVTKRSRDEPPHRRLFRRQRDSAPRGRPWIKAIAGAGADPTVTRRCPCESGK